MTSSSNQTPKPILVRKYGGSSLASVDRIKSIANDIHTKHSSGFRLVIVVSAMGQTTNELAALANEVSPTPSRRELDMLLSVGERITMSLLSMALDDLGCPSISFTGSQCGVITDSSHTEAEIIEVKGDRVREALNKDQVVVVAGFQGVSLEKEITSLGRGGSDLTAVALAAALGADRCEILKDVDGVFTADPNQVSTANLHDTLSYEELEQIAGTGCGVVHSRAVNHARKHSVQLFVGSSFHNSSGTIISPANFKSETTNCPENTPYKPLAITLTDGISLLECTIQNQGNSSELLDKFSSCIQCNVPLQEWVDFDSNHISWNLLADASVLETINDKISDLLIKEGVHHTHSSELSCLSLAGRPPLNWVDTSRKIITIIEDNDIADYRIICSDTNLRILLNPAEAVTMLPIIHDNFF
jgi:aspartate kinase